MERAEFHPYLVALHFVAVGGQCECTGCSFVHYGRCAETFTFADRTTSDSDFGWQADHKCGAWSNDVGNLRILCVDCHKRTPSYGRNDPTRGLGALSSLGAPPADSPPPGPSLAKILAAQNPFGAPSAPAPKTDWLSALLAPPPSLLVDPVAEMVRAIMGGPERKP